jgi:hypothetical protein
MNHPIDWDHESYCSVYGCKNPATHTLTTHTVDYPEPDTGVGGLICCTHAHTSGDG